MKIWIDFINTPQVTFFVPFINNFKKENHEILLTCRDSGNTVELLKQFNLSYSIVGERTGNGLLQKLFFFPIRLFKLFFIVKKLKPNIAVSQSSFYQPIIARLLNIPCLYTNDNEHAKGNIFGFYFATKVMLPIALRNQEFVNKWPLKNKLSFYPSVKEAIYLSQIISMKGISSKSKDKVYFRPEPWSAQYYNGSVNFFDDILLKLTEEFNVVVLPRDRKQKEYYEREKFKSLRVIKKPISLNDIIADCLLFIGAGGSMSREMSVLEIPVISIYQADLLCVDRYLVERGLMHVDPDITYSGIKNLLNSLLKSKKTWKVLQEGQDSYAMILNSIYQLRTKI